MNESSFEAAQSVFLLLLLFVIVFAVLARRLQTPYPIVLVIGGLLLGFVPGIPMMRLHPEIVFLLVLPPLLYSAAWNTSWTEFRHNLVSIAFLAIGLVAFTVLGVSLMAPLLLEGFDWRLGFVLGAVVATTDALAATSIATRVGLPERLLDILEGESLVNDATGLLALEFATAMVVNDQIPTVAGGIYRLVYLGVIGIGVGLLLARIVEWFEDRIDDGPIEIAISILVPYAAYLSAEMVKASGVLAVVSAGLYLSRQSSRFFSPGVRLQANAVWNALTFIVNGFVFILIGLQLPYVMGEIRGMNRGELLLYGGLFSGLLILLRFLWVYPGAYAGYWVRKNLLHQHGERRPEARGVFIIGWTGMRGVIALAAAISLPRALADGADFPQRSLIVFLTFSVILVTLVLQGLALPPLIRALKLAGSNGPPCEEMEARRLVTEAALAYLEQNRKKDDARFGDLYSDLAEHYRHRLASLRPSPEESGNSGRERYDRYLDLSRKMLAVERKAALDLRNEGRINDDVLREIEHGLDLNETRLNEAKAKERSFGNGLDGQDSERR